MDHGLENPNPHIAGKGAPPTLETQVTVSPLAATHDLLFFFSSSLLCLGRLVGDSVITSLHGSSLSSSSFFLLRKWKKIGIFTVRFRLR